MMATGAASSKMATGTLLILTTFLAALSLTKTAVAAPVTAAQTITETSSDSAREPRVQKMRQLLIKSRSARFIAGTMPSIRVRLPGLTSC